MKQSCYINGISNVSAQQTFGNQFFVPTYPTKPIFEAINPPYKNYIKPMQLRRMSKAVKMGVTGAQFALHDANINQPDAIITGTGMGCRQDSEAFLKTMLDNDEQFLSPTPFIQSTHNTIGGQIALHLKCQAYNTTYVQASAALESALIDGLLTLNETETDTQLLIGTIDEIAENYSKLYQENDHVKRHLDDKGGTTMSEGASFFVCSNLKSSKSYAELVGVSLKQSVENDTIENFVASFLERHGLNTEAIDAVILGTNGDANFDNHYKDLQQNLFQANQQLHYKHLSGEHNSATGFALWLTCMVLKEQSIPEHFRLNRVKKKPLKTVLLYNQYRGKNHSLMLLETV